MTGREVFQSIMHFRRPERLMLWNVEGVSESAVRSWICQGHLPLGVRRTDAVAFDGPTIIRLDTDPLPAFVERTIEEDAEWRTTTDAYGFTVRTSKSQAVGPTHYYYLDGPVHNRDDWRRMRARFDPADPRRRPRCWGPDYFISLTEAAGPVMLRIDWGPGRGIKNGYMMGMERFLHATTDEPEMLEEMFDFWADFVLALLGDWLESIRFDAFLICEDGMGFRNSTMVSPEMYRRIWGPHVRRVVEHVRGRGVDVVGYYTSGNVQPLIPTLLELGVNLHLPLESAAGLDARRLRREYPRDLLMMGNISRQSLMDGPDAVQREFERKVPRLVEAGGYAPTIDDLIMPDVPYASVRRYAELIQAYRP